MSHFTWRSQLTIILLQYLLEYSIQACYLFFFQSAWSSDLKKNLKAFLSATLKSLEKPKIYDLYQRTLSENEKERKLYNEELKKLQAQLARRDQQFLHYEKRCSKIQGLSVFCRCCCCLWVFCLCLLVCSSKRVFNKV